MAYLTETSTWEAGVFQLELTTSATGGPGGVMNAQAQTLANRTAWLKGQVELRAPTASPQFTGIPIAPTATQDTNTSQLATTAFMLAQASSISPAMNGTAAAGGSLRYARADHVHPSDTGKLGTAGGDLSGLLRILMASPSLILEKTSGAGGSAALEGRAGGKLRWSLEVGGSGAESTGNVGSDCVLTHYDDDGNPLGPIWTTYRSTGLTKFFTPVEVPVPAADAQAARRRDIGIELIAQADLSGANTVEVTIPDGFVDLRFALSGVDVPASGLQTIWMQVKRGGAWVTATGQYYQARTFNSQNAGLFGQAFADAMGALFLGYCGYSVGPSAVNVEGSLTGIDSRSVGRHIGAFSRCIANSEGSWSWVGYQADGILANHPADQRVEAIRFYNSATTIQNWSTGRLTVLGTRKL